MGKNPWPNIREDAYGYQPYLKHRGKQYSKRFPRDAKREDMERWLARQRAILEYDLVAPQAEPADAKAKTARFEHDVERYLASVQTMPSIGDRTLHMHDWAKTFAGRDRNSVTSIEIKTQLEQWRARLSESSCNKRRTALMAFFTALNGKSGYNPVRDVPKYHEDEHPRSRHPLTILRVLSFMRPTKTRARLHVMLWTGWPHAQIKKLKAEHRDYWKQGRAFVTPRRKGKGHRGVWLPLLPQAVKALEEFHKADAYGTFSRGGMRSAFRRALTKLNAHRAKLKLPALSMRPYDIRHTFGTFVAKRTKDDRVVQELLLHSRPEQSLRYSREATESRVREAIAALSDASIQNRGNGGSSVSQRGQPETTKRQKR